MKSPTQNSLKWLRGNNYHAQVVERWNAFAKIRQDLFGWIDIVAVHPMTGIWGVQTTTVANVNARWEKARGNRALRAWLQAGGHLVIHGWNKQKNKWVLHTERHLSQEDTLA